MFSEKDLIKEIWEVVDEITNSGAEPPKSWITRGVLKRHPAPEGPDQELFHFSLQETVGRAVRRAMGRLKAKEDQMDQHELLMPGYKRLQRFYLVPRDDEHVVVRLENMSCADIDAKIAEYQSMAEGCRQHVQELRRYARQLVAA